MKVIVFGGSGFLGSHVADALTAAGHRVAVFDRRPSPWIQRGQEMIVGDILDAAAVNRATRGRDVVYNFAGFADIEAARHQPLATIQSNILGNGVLLEAARQHKVRRFVFASTVYVYSDHGSFYRASKQACESYIEGYRQIYGLPHTILRFGSLYGPRSDERNGIFRLVKQALETRKIVYWGSGEEIREYIHVSDAARCAVRVLAPDYANRCVILTGHQPLRVRDVLTMIREILGGRVRVEYRPRSRPGIADLHYTMTPYSFTPREGKKLVPTEYVDMGQGLLSVVGELHGRRSARR